MCTENSLKTQPSETHTRYEFAREIFFRIFLLLETQPLPPFQKLNPTGGKPQLARPARPGEGAPFTIQAYRTVYYTRPGRPGLAGPARPARPGEGAPFIIQAYRTAYKFFFWHFPKPKPSRTKTRFALV